MREDLENKIPIQCVKPERVEIDVTRRSNFARQIHLIAIGELSPWDRNARSHSMHQIRQIAESIKTFGFTNPILIHSSKRILAGHGRLEAARLLEYKTALCLYLNELNEAQKRAYVLADNQLVLNAGWDEEVSSDELKALSQIDLGFDLDITGFSLAEID